METFVTLYLGQRGEHLEGKLVILISGSEFHLTKHLWTIYRCLFALFIQCDNNEDWICFNDDIM